MCIRDSADSVSKKLFETLTAEEEVHQDQFETCLLYTSIYDLEGIGCDGKILVIPDHNIEIITGGETENIHSPC